MKLKFGLTDFSSDPRMVSDDPVIALAQAAFDAWYSSTIESAPVVYGYKNTSGSWVWSDKTNRTPDTHKACLCFVEELKKEPCKAHDPSGYGDDDPAKPVKCLVCGTKLKQVITWEPA